MVDVVSEPLWRTVVAMVVYATVVCESVLASWQHGLEIRHVRQNRKRETSRDSTGGWPRPSSLSRPALSRPAHDFSSLSRPDPLSQQSRDFSSLSRPGG